MALIFQGQRRKFWYAEYLSNKQEGPLPDAKMTSAEVTSSVLSRAALATRLVSDGSEGSGELLVFAAKGLWHTEDTDELAGGGPG
eukprot:CAMPEP_0184303920 /NCGR_PEP_ID=MMETSP1049-20130417/13580_1 /TAXON_ID=77928 /ORGANISM="Proteomonas sulcata, Strain CCMP704" /LENGTH=84 /DNA_ID=CAMNT_0026615621 /DNA_START=345 /DNA_END=599 /DNA_ORIENTATION=+